MLLLMLPVTISLGLINFNLVINSLFGTLVSDQAPAAIDKAFRIYMLPQGIFSVAIATVALPDPGALRRPRRYDDLRATMANGMRQILLLLVPAAAAILVLSEPMIELVYQRGEFDAAQTELVAEALFWFAFSLPFNGLFLLLTRTFFSLQRPLGPDRDLGAQPRDHRGRRLALYGPSGSAGSSPRRRSRPPSVAAQAVILRAARRHRDSCQLIDQRASGGAASRRWPASVWDLLEELLGDGSAPDRLLGGWPARGAFHLLAAVTSLRVPRSPSWGARRAASPRDQLAEDTKSAG